MNKQNDNILKTIEVDNMFDPNGHISVIVPTFNEANSIENLIHRLKNDEFVHQIIVADSPQSTDNMEVICQNNDIQYCKCTHSGRAFQMNQGAELADQSIYYFIHADAIPPKGFGKNIITKWQGKKHAGYFSYTFDQNSFWLNLNAKATRLQNIFSGGGDQSLFICEKLFKQLNGFCEEYVIMEDFELIQRIKSKGIKPVLIKNDLTVSARKYQKNSYLKVNLVNAYVFTLFHFGVKPEKLKHIYSRLINR